MELEHLESGADDSSQQKNKYIIDEEILSSQENHRMGVEYYHFLQELVFDYVAQRP
jgi:hypothetical protein